MRLIQLCLMGSLLGCGAKSAGPPPVTTAQREAIKQNLTPLKARVTSEAPEGLFLSLRNTYIEIREFGGAIEGTPRTRQDVQEFGLASEAVAKAFLEAGELDGFKQWLREALSPRSPAAVRAEYARFTVNLSRVPLRLVFSQKQTAEVP
jgi:hypothetical protein